MTSPYAKLPCVLNATPVGSRRTCLPPPTDTDDDHLLLIDNHDGFEILILSMGFNIDGSDVFDHENRTPFDERFVSYKHKDNAVNLIVTTSPIFEKRFIAATAVATRLNLLNKSDRIALFQAVLYGNS